MSPLDGHSLRQHFVEEVEGCDMLQFTTELSHTHGLPSTLPGTCSKTAVSFRATKRGMQQGKFFQVEPVQVEKGLAFQDARANACHMLIHGNLLSCFIRGSESLKA